MLRKSVEEGKVGKLLLVDVLGRESIVVGNLCSNQRSRAKPRLFGADFTQGWLIRS